MTNYKEIAYLDNAATTPVPKSVIETINNYYGCRKVSVHRGMYDLAGEVTRDYEHVRDQVAQWIGASNRTEVIFTSGTTEGLNLVANSYGITNLTDQDQIIVSIFEHHSNFVPWQQIAKKTGATLKVVGMTPDGQLDLNELEHVINSKTKIVALSMMSNVLGNLVPVKEVADLIHRQNGILVVDAAQSVAHVPVNVQNLGADFLAFSAHKMFGPTGVGVLFGREQLLKGMPPIQYGGEMVDQVDLKHTSFQNAPIKFEAGTPNIAGVLGLGTAIDYIQDVGYQTIEQREQVLMDRLLSGLRAIKSVKIYGPQVDNQHFGVVSFNVGDYHAHDVATILNSEGVAVRAGHLCAEPLMNQLGISSVVRASITFETTLSEIKCLIDAVRKVEDILK